MQLIKLTQETIDMERNLAELTIKKETPQVTLEELVNSMKTTADDVGQISELTTEEKLKVATLGCLRIWKLKEKLIKKL